jgi:hypothetical protein
MKYYSPINPFNIDSAVGHALTNLNPEHSMHTGGRQMSVNDQEGFPQKDGGPKNCPRCGLTNPSTAQRCDCGFDFLSKSVEKPYFKQKIPKDIKTFITVLVPLNIAGAALSLASGDVFKFIFVLVWSSVVYSMYAQLLQKKNWARIALAILTFPWGIFLGLSREAKLYCLQKE